MVIHLGSVTLRLWHRRYCIEKFSPPTVPSRSASFFIIIVVVTFQCKHKCLILMYVLYFFLRCSYVGLKIVHTVFQNIGHFFMFKVEF